MNPQAILLGGVAGWFLAGLLDKQPLFRGVLAAAGAYAGNAIANAPAAQAATPRVTAPQPKASAAPGTSDTLSPANLAASPDLNDTGGGGGNF